MPAVRRILHILIEKTHPVRAAITQILILTISLLVITLPISKQSCAQSTSFDEDDIEVSYIYAAVKGTGTYRINNRRITMMRLPINWMQREPTDTSAGWRWLLPLVFGYDDLSNVDSDLIDALLPDKLVTLTALPGFEYIHPVTPRWQVKPFLQIGGGRDYSADRSFAMTQIGVRNVNLFEPAERWELRWGNALRWAAEYQFKTDDRTSFGIVETGLDMRRDMLFQFLDRNIDIGAYYIFQYYLPEWDIGNAPNRDFRTRNLNELGLSAGFKDYYSTLGFKIRRVRIGYQRGGNFRGWRFGTEFPF